MKKFVVITLMAAMLLAVVSMAAMADATNWLIQFKATDSANMNYNTAINIGCTAGFTDGTDTAKGEPGSLGAPSVGKTIATVAAVLNGVNAARDFKAPIVEGETKTWDLTLYVLDNQGAGLNGFNLTMTPNASTSAPVYKIGNTDYQFVITGSFLAEPITYKAGSALPTAKTWTVASGTLAAGTVGTMQIKFAPVPEPSSMVALASGLVGMAGFAIRRRRA